MKCPRCGVRQLLLELEGALTAQIELELGRVPAGISGLREKEFSGRS